MQLRFTTIDLALAHRFTIACHTRTSTPCVLIELSQDGIVGYGEASLPPYLGETQDSVIAFLSQLDLSRFADPFRLDNILDYIDRLALGNCAAKAALDIALHDWIGKSLGQPLYRLWGLSPERVTTTSYTIGMDSDDLLRQKIREAAPYKLLKIKLGSADDRRLIEFIRSETDKPLCVDANQGWRSRQESLHMVRWLSSQGVIFVEQPFDKFDLDSSRWLTQRASIPIIADESCRRLNDIASLQGCFSGINIKLMKCTGLHEARMMISTARALEMKVMLGCMTETSCGVSAAAQLAPLADWIDLDGNLLITNDPFCGVPIEEGRHLLLPSTAGIQITLKKEHNTIYE